MELELKHIDKYFIHRLEVISNERKQNEKCLLTQINIGVDKDLVLLQGYNEEFDFFEDKLKNIKPILHPLSSLTEQELIDNGIETHIDYLIDGFDVLDVPYRVFEYLVSKHYDVFKLIPQGLAIDYNTLNK